MGLRIGWRSDVEQTLYTRFGDWFGWLMVLSLVGLVVVGKKK